MNATHLIPLLWQLAYSEALIARDAFARSISPRQNFSKPPPVPEMPTVIADPGWTLRYSSSAAAVVQGPTVLEPSAVMLPFSCGAFAPAATAVPQRNQPDRKKQCCFPHSSLPLWWVSPASWKPPSPAWAPAW